MSGVTRSERVRGGDLRARSPPAAGRDPETSLSSVSSRDKPAARSRAWHTGTGWTW
jgi:hypothetical protein